MTKKISNKVIDKFLKLPFINSEFIAKNFDMELADSICESLKKVEGMSVPMFSVLLDFASTDTERLKEQKYWATIFRMVSSLDYKQIVANINYTRSAFIEILSQSLFDIITREAMNYSSVYGDYTIEHTMVVVMEKVSEKLLDNYTEDNFDDVTKMKFGLSGLKVDEYVALHLMFGFYSVYLQTRFVQKSE